MSLARTLRFLCFNNATARSPSTADSILSSSMSSGGAVVGERLNDISRRNDRRMAYRHGAGWRYTHLVTLTAPLNAPQKPRRTHLATRGARPRRLMSAAETGDPFATELPSDHMPSPSLSSPSVAESPCTSTSSSKEIPAAVPSDDPLIQFLHDNADDGPLLLSTLTSLQRSLVHGHEVTEQVALAIRRVFHRLVRSRAWDVAARLYVRLVSWGVSLQSSDVAVLLSNLPYDQSTTDPAAQKEWYAPSHDAKHHGRRSLSKGSPSQKENLPQPPPQAQSVQSNEPLDAPPFGNVMVPPLSSENRSLWLRRWRAYEMAMGNIPPPLADLDVPESVDEAAELCRHDPTLRQPLPSGTAEEHLRIVLDHLAAIRPPTGTTTTAISREALHLVTTYLNHHKPKVLSDAIATAVIDYVAYDVRRYWRTAADVLRQVHCSREKEQYLALLVLLGQQQTPRRARVTNAPPSTLAHRVHHALGANSAARLAQNALALVDGLLLTDDQRVREEDVASRSVVVAATQMFQAVAQLRIECEQSSPPNGSRLPRECLLSCELIGGLVAQFSRKYGPVLHGATMHEDPNFVDRWTRTIAEQWMALWTTHYDVEGQSPSTSRAILLAPERPSVAATLCKTLLSLADIVKHPSLLAQLERTQYQQRFATTDRLRGAPEEHILRKRQRQQTKHFLSLAITSSLLASSTTCFLLSSSATLMRAVRGNQREALLPSVGSSLNHTIRSYQVHRANEAFMFTNNEYRAISVAAIELISSSCRGRLDLRALRLGCTAFSTVMILANPATQPAKLARHGVSGGVVRMIDTLSSSLTVPHRPTRVPPSSARMARRAPAVTALPRRLLAVTQLTPEQRDAITSRRMVCEKVDAWMRVKGEEGGAATPQQHDEEHALRTDLLGAGTASWFAALTVMHRLLVGNKRHDPLELETYHTALRCLAQPDASKHTWQSAVAIFWHAVDGSAPRRASSSHNSHPDEDAKENVSQRSTLSVLTALIGPLLHVAAHNGLVASHGRRWNEHWQRLYAEKHASSDVLGSTSYLLQRLENSVALRERDALPRIQYFRKQVGAVDAHTNVQFDRLVLQAVEQQCARGEWTKALRFASQENGAIKHQAMMMCLAACQTSLYRTVDRVIHEAEQTAVAADVPMSTLWSPRCSELALQVYLRSRRWMDALTFLSHPQLVKSHLRDRQLIVQGLRSCAIGGAVEPAELLLDRFNVVSAGTLTSTEEEPSLPITRQDEPALHSPLLSASRDAEGGHTSSTPSSSTVSAIEKSLDLLLNGAAAQPIQKVDTLDHAARAFFLRSLSKAASQRVRAGIRRSPSHAAASEALPSKSL